MTTAIKPTAYQFAPGHYVIHVGQDVIGYVARGNAATRTSSYWSADDCQIKTWHYTMREAIAHLVARASKNQQVTP